MGALANKRLLALVAATCAIGLGVMAQGASSSASFRSSIWPVTPASGTLSYELIGAGSEGTGYWERTGNAYAEDHGDCGSFPSTPSVWCEGEAMASAWETDDPPRGGSAYASRSGVTSPILRACNSGSENVSVTFWGTYWYKVSTSAVGSERASANICMSWIGCPVWNRVYAGVGDSHTIEFSDYLPQFARVLGPGQSVSLSIDPDAWASAFTPSPPDDPEPPPPPHLRPSALNHRV